MGEVNKDFRRDSHGAFPSRSISLGGDGVVQTEVGRTVVALGATDGVANLGQVGVGEQVGSSLVASWGNLLGDEEVETGIHAVDPESAGGVDAGSAPLWDVGEGSVGVSGDERGAFDTGVFLGSGLDHGEGVAGCGLKRRGGFLQALGAVWDAAGAELRDIEDAALLDSGSRCESNGDGRDDSR
ncbi:hypothetical protein BTUL_0211g00030 [Botrytis tulipae]|uniref:Uncharacterized protein n=1 Tax=Botrytis tulipae TaxID=87230 RepID=A0A4Z1E882_9HELO|nr:hypothetical protein BTUL_0211g00030 [Botrytis tulipae]